MKNKRNNYSSAFKAKVAQAAVKGDQMIAELASQYEVYLTQIAQWKKQLLESLSDVFGNSRQKERGE